MLKISHFILLIALFFTFSQQSAGKGRGITNTSFSPYVKLRSIDIDDVKWTKGFWAEKFEVMQSWHS